MCRGISCLTIAIRGRTLFDCENGTVANNLINNVVIGWGAFRLIAELDWGIAMNFNEHKKRQNTAIVDALMAQKKQNDVLIDAMEEKIEFLKEELICMEDARYCRYAFFEKHPELIPEYVATVYKKSESNEYAKQEVAYFHDEILDLSTLECTGTDFKK